MKEETHIEKMKMLWRDSSSSWNQPVWRRVEVVWSQSSIVFYYQQLSLGRYMYVFECFYTILLLGPNFLELKSCRLVILVIALQISYCVIVKVCLFSSCQLSLVFLNYIDLVIFILCSFILAFF